MAHGVQLYSVLYNNFLIRAFGCNARCNIAQKYLASCNRNCINMCNCITAICYDIYLYSVCFVIDGVIGSISAKNCLILPE